MKSFKAFCIGTIATVAMATGASAQTFSPPGSVTLTSDGPLAVSKGLTLSCTLAGTGTITSGGAHTVGSLALSGTLCNAVSFTGFPYSVTSNSLTSVTINNVSVIGITGNCQGNLTGSFNQATGVISFNNAQIPSSPAGGAPCVIDGDVLTSPAVSFTIP